MNTHMFVSPRRRLSGFTMIEMIGVLAIIAILAVIVVPKVFSTIASSRVTSTVASINAARSSLTEFCGRYGTIPITTNNSRIDDLLVAANMLDNRFVVKIGAQPGSALATGAAWSNTTGTWTAAGGSTQTAQSRIICLTSNTNNPSTANGANFRLSGGATNLPAGSRVVSAVIVGVPIGEARNLSLSIDGEPLSTTTAQATTADNNGKVVYAAAAATGTTTVYVYLAHQ
jgi:prepilin-type N-terminal cleavage/methylation domain-containing protein